MSTHFSGLSNEDTFFFPMFMRLLSINPGPYFFFTAVDIERGGQIGGGGVGAAAVGGKLTVFAFRRLGMAVGAAAALRRH